MSARTIATCPVVGDMPDDLRFLTRRSMAILVTTPSEDDRYPVVVADHESKRLKAKKRMSHQAVAPPLLREPPT
jgi:hypothetical protein